MTPTKYQVRVAGAASLRSQRSRGRRGRRSRTTSSKPWRSLLRDRSTSASRTGWSWRRSWDWRIRRSRPGTKIEGEFCLFMSLYLCNIERLRWIATSAMGVMGGSKLYRLKYLRKRHSRDIDELDFRALFEHNTSITMPYNITFSF